MRPDVIKISLPSQPAVLEGRAGFLILTTIKPNKDLYQDAKHPLCYHHPLKLPEYEYPLW